MLIPAAAKKNDIPMTASGGLGGARGRVAALALGADGINMGTRFMATAESCIQQNVKDAIVAHDDRAVWIFRIVAEAEELITATRRHGRCDSHRTAETLTLR